MKCKNKIVVLIQGYFGKIFTFVANTIYNSTNK